VLHFGNAHDASRRGAEVASLVTTIEANEGGHLGTTHKYLATLALLKHLASTLFYLLVDRRLSCFACKPLAKAHYFD